IVVEDRDRAAYVVDRPGGCARRVAAHLHAIAIALAQLECARRKQEPERDTAIDAVDRSHRMPRRDHVPDRALVSAFDEFREEVRSFVRGVRFDDGVAARRERPCVGWQAEAAFADAGGAAWAAATAT